ncbi:Rho-N domain-containing protein 1 chloroplastic [Zea mays]|uniref:Rho-N domain-containing protein 1 chloroplastic n=2 Tax=Zea mays TaxID=4577 RepID=A0A1D6QBN2_MAIZE|nr:Rho-N domain-containing protein 1 chloroplastic [Zea mays]
MVTSPMLGPIRVSLVCSASPNHHRPRISDISQLQKEGSSRGKGRSYQDKDDSENIDEYDSDIMFSRNGPPISLASTSRPQDTSAPGEREMEIVELFKRVQALLRARVKGREKKPEPAKVHGERGSVDSLIKLLRKHSVDQRRKSSDEKEQNFGVMRRSNDSGNRRGSTIFGTKSDIQEEQKKQPPAPFKRPASNFRRRSPVPGVKFQPVINVDVDTDADRKSMRNNVADAVQMAKTALDERTATDEPDYMSPYEPDSVIEAENISLDDLDDISDDDEESDAGEPDNEYPELSLEIADVTDIDELHESSDLSSLKVAELRELAKSRGIKGYSKTKKNELIEVLSSSMAWWMKTGNYWPALRSRRRAEASCGFVIHAGMGGAA